MDLIVEHCPRCLARSGRVTELRLSEEACAFSGVPVGQPTEPLRPHIEPPVPPPESVDQPLGPELEDSTDVDEPGEAEIELQSMTQLG